MKHVLVTGGAGYIGSLLLQQLLEKGYTVTCIDSLRFGGESIVDLLNHPRFSFIKGDIRNEHDISEALKKHPDAVVHLAAIVGDPACAKEPDLAKATNLDGSKKLYQMSEHAGVKQFIFASTCSNYGKMKHAESYVTEDSTLAPVSLYAETKVAFEQFLSGQNRENTCKPTSLRFSTVYGLSRRPRFDLTVNEFAREVALGRELVIFGEQFWRPYCHVVDLARSVITVLEASPELVAFDVFNVGDTKENYQKKMLAGELLKLVPHAKVKYVQKNEDPRDYRVNFDKIQKKLNFKITIDVPTGIRQLLYAIQNGFYSNIDDVRFKNS